MSDVELLDEQDVATVARERVGSGGSHDPCPDDDDLGLHRPIFAVSGAAVRSRICNSSPRPLR